MRGFTLVELSIVLVIIGLLVGGILVAQSMISTTQIQSQIRQLEQFDIATTNFKNSYKQLPGDCNICDRISPFYVGNNNGLINDGTPSTPAISLWIEPYHYFIDLSQMRHLKDAYQFLSGNYDIGVNKQFPKAAIGRGGFVVNSAANGDLYYITLYRGSSTNESNFSTLMAEGNFSPAEAAALDTKIDNANPATGNIVAIAVASSSGTYPYNLETDNAANCVSGGKYNAVLTATNLCRMAIKAQSIK